MRSSILSLAVLLSVSAAFARPSILVRTPTDACIASCNAIGATLANCNYKLDCLCTADNSKALVACANCSIEGANTAEQVAGLKLTVSQYTGQCDAAGMSVGTLVLTATPISTAAATATTAALQTSAVALTNSVSAVAASATAVASTLAASAPASAATSTGYKNLGSGTMGVVASVVIAAFIGFM